MPQLIKQGALVADDWLLLDNSQTHAPLTDGKLLLPLELWQAQKEQLRDRPHLGVWLDSDEEPSLLCQDLDRLELIGINFPVFSDGRGYSYVRLLRERYHYRGELRAIGDVLIDQLFYMKRCGFDAFALRDDQDTLAAMASLNTFSDSYQAATDQTEPLFQRR